MTTQTTRHSQKVFSYSLATLSGLTTGAAAAAISVLLLSVLAI